jgi:hypothetical protein
MAYRHLRKQDAASIMIPPSLPGLGNNLASQFAFRIQMSTRYFCSNTTQIKRGSLSTCTASCARHYHSDVFFLLWCGRDDGADRMPRPGLVVISRTVKALFRVRSRAGGPDQAKAGTLVRALGTGLLTFSRFFFMKRDG